MWDSTRLFGDDSAQDQTCRVVVREFIDSADSHVLAASLFSGADGPDRARSGPAVACGIFCNALVCLVVWLCMGARTVTDRILTTVFLITAFVACGFEHSVVNMYVLLIGGALTAGISAPLSATEAVSKLALVTLGNILRGTVLVALAYWSVYLSNSE
ncbi:MAG: formate/nitrite transporter family protein [Nitrospiraceae bacterium]|nr:formate/nitrite transporter family protein [Nitrospiraceae bacterium]